MRKNTQPLRLETKKHSAAFDERFFSLKKISFYPPPENFGGRRENARTAKAKRTELEINKKQGALKKLVQQTTSCQKSHEGIEGTLQNDVPETICRR